MQCFHVIQTFCLYYFTFLTITLETHNKNQKTEGVEGAWRGQNLQYTLLMAQCFYLSSINKRLQHRRFPVTFEKFLRTSFLQNTSDGCFRKSYLKSLLGLKVPSYVLVKPELIVIDSSAILCVNIWPTKGLVSDSVLFYTNFLESILFSISIHFLHT